LWFANNAMTRSQQLGLVVLLFIFIVYVFLRLR
jgi:hypothetical protein